jgi:hydroxyacylglutathione hydrolase
MTELDEYLETHNHADDAREIFRSHTQKLLTLPDHCEVWPRHLGGSTCGGPAMNMKISSTIGCEPANNPTLRITDAKNFAAQALARLGPSRRTSQATVDVRADRRFDEAPIPGSACIPMHPAGFGAKLT